MKKLVCILIFVSAVTLISACSRSPLAQYHNEPTLNFAVEQGNPFLHQVIKRELPGQQPKVLHVYIEGDGRPWWTRYEIANNPTPRRLPMLELLLMDNADALYLGRPCYFNLQDPACEPLWWTHGRYSAKVVASMNAVLNKYGSRYDAIRLFGHSGGGTLAMLIAANRSDVKSVVTLAGNLDIEAWASHHGYSPLTSSLNPVDFPLAATVQQMHFVGSEDKAVPAWLVEQSAKKLGENKALIVQGINHHCCWDSRWHAILNTVRKGDKKP